MKPGFKMKLKQFRAFLLGWYLGLFIPAFGQVELDLADCLQMAYQNSNLVKSAEVAYQAAEKKFALATTDRLPAVNLGSLYTRIGKISSFSIPMGPAGEMRKFQFGTPNRINLDLRLDWPLYTGGRMSGIIAVSSQALAAAGLQREQQRSRLTDQVIARYYSYLLERESIRLQESNLQRSEHFLEITQKRFDEGGVPRLEVLRAQVQVQSALSAVEESRANLEKSKIALAKALGRLEADFNISGQFRFLKIIVDENDLIQRALERRVDLKLTQTQKNIQQDQITIAKSGNKPNVFFFSGYNIINGFDPLDPSRLIDNWNAGFQVSVPLFDGFATSYQVQEARLNLKNAEIQQQELRDLIRMQVRQALISLAQAEQKISTQHQNIALAQQVLKIADDQYQLGLASALDVLDAQNRLTQGEFFHAQAIFNHAMAKLELSRAIEDYSLFQTGEETR